MTTVVSDMAKGASAPSRAVDPVGDQCAHCGQPTFGTLFCCPGCEVVHGALKQRGLTRFYTLRDGRGIPPGSLRLHTTWLEPVAEQLATSAAPRILRFDLQGLHCAACVWLIERLFEGRPGAHRVLVNPGLGQLELLVSSDFALVDFARELSRFGYTIGPAHRKQDANADGLLLRLGICSALALNSMVLSAALYFGLSEGPLWDLFRQLIVAMGAVSVAVGGSVFVTAAWRAARQRILHLDQPIALGIVLAFAGSLMAWWQGGEGFYFDTLSVFVALMLAGRWLQERVLADNRKRLLQDDGIDQLVTRRVRDGHLQWVTCGELQQADELWIAPGDLVPASALLLEEQANFALEWIDGESEPRRFSRNETVPAGAFNAGAQAVRVRLRQAFESSALRAVLGEQAGQGQSQGDRFWQRLSAVYVVLVLAVACAAGGVWAWLEGPNKGLSVATALLVVTCPCAFGIATPLAYEMVLSRLRRAGLFVRSRGFIDRALQVRQLVLDKTGTLTTGTLSLEDPALLQGLSDARLELLYQLAAHSTHPKATALAAELAGRCRLRDDLRCTEVAGMGVQATVDGVRYRLGAPHWACPDGAEGSEDDLSFSEDGREVVHLRTREQARPDAARERQALQDAGYDVWMLTGDRRQRALRLGEQTGFEPAQIVAGCSPEGKAKWLAQHDPEHTLMIGDGVNDAPAMRVALAGGTPAVDRPFMPARTDFYFVTAGLSPIRQALHWAHRLRRVVVANLALALAYNLLAVAIACAGWMQPWLAAVLMPVSSLSVIALTVVRLSERRSPWKS